MEDYKPDAMNFDRVNTTLSRSGLPSEEDLQYLHDVLNVKTILNFCTKSNVESERKAAEKIGLNYIHLPWSAHFYNILRLNYYWNIANIFLAYVQNHEHQPLHVHCFHGRERTGMIVAIYRMVVDKYSFKDALEEMKSYGFKPHLHFTLVIFLWVYSISHKK